MGNLSCANRRRANCVVFIAALTAFLAVGTAAAWNIIAIRQGYAAAQAEYESLRRAFSPAAGIRQTAQPVDVAEMNISTAETESEPTTAPDLTAINPDYVGWITIGGTTIGYPVVQGQDNEKYLTTSFSGEINHSGAIFMDAGCAGGFESPFSILYGHNMKDGSMFAGLNRYLEDGYLAGHPEIAVTTRDGETLTYQIFAVRVTDTSDAAYTLFGKSREEAATYFTELSAPDGAVILILSTCTNGGGRNKRLIVFAAR